MSSCYWGCGTSTMSSVVYEVSVRAAGRGGYVTGANSGAGPVTALGPPVWPEMGGEAGSRAAALLLAAGQYCQCGGRSNGRVSCAEPVPAIAAKLQFMGIPDPKCAICSISLHRSAFRLTGKYFIIRFLENPISHSYYIAGGLAVVVHCGWPLLSAGDGRERQEDLQPLIGSRHPLSTKQSKYNLSFFYLFVFFIFIFTRKGGCERPACDRDPDPGGGSRLTSSTTYLDCQCHLLLGSQLHPVGGGRRRPLSPRHNRPSARVLHQGIVFSCIIHGSNNTNNCVYCCAINKTVFMCCRCSRG